MRILIADRLDDSVVARLEAGGNAVTMAPELKGEALVAGIQDIAPDVLVVRSTRVQGEHLTASERLALVIRAGAGVNTIDVTAAAQRGIYVANCPGKNAIAVAELTMGHLVNLDRRLPDNVAELRAGRWRKKEFGKAAGLFGKRLAILGTGRIGSEVIVRARAFGMEISAWSRSLTPTKAQALGVQYAATPLDACRGAHALSIHLALTDDTRHLVGRELLEALAIGAFVVNASRAEVLDHDALLSLIEDRQLRVALDVFPDEPNTGQADYTSPIATHPRVYGSHHIGASTTQAAEAVGSAVVEIIETYQAEGRVLNCVNLASQSAATCTLIVRHADRVGVLAGVLDALRQAEINVQEMDNIVFAGGAAACARIQLSSEPTRAVLDNIAAATHVYTADVVSHS